MSSPTHLDIATRQITFARQYTLTLLEGLDDADWFRIPPGSPTHIAWQVGHLAMAQYMLTLFRLRGKTDADELMIPKAFLKRFVKGSTPAADSTAYPPPAEIRQRFDAVHAQLLSELPGIAPTDLDAPVGEPYVAFPTKLGSLLFCSHHEMLHAGQIGLTRRLMGKPTIR